MDIKGDPYGIDSDVTIVNPIGQAIINPAAGSSSDVSYFTYNSPVIDCMDPTILNRVRETYERCDISSGSAIPPKPQFNRMISVLEWFNPAPNICEYKMNIQHTYFDIDYGYYYTIPPPPAGSPPLPQYTPPVFTKDDQPSYIVAKWAPDTDYDVETGNIILNKPIVDEYFYPDLDLRADGKFYRTSKPTDTTPLNMPYLSGEGLSAAGSSNSNGIDYTKQPPRFTTLQTPQQFTPTTYLDQTAWPSCRCAPDQSIDSVVQRELSGSGPISCLPPRS